MERRHSHHQFITLGGTSTRPKYTTRHLAALDFLLNVPMKREEEIRQNGLFNATKLREENEEIQLQHEANGLLPLLSSSYSTVLGGEKGHNGNGNTNHNTTTPAHNNNNNNNNNSGTAIGGTASTDLQLAAQFADYAGKKLQGPHCPVGRYPVHFRYHLQRLTEQSALVRLWEDQLLSKTTITNLNTMKSNLPPEPSLLSNRIYFSRVHCYPMMVYSVIKYDAGEEKARLEKLKAEDRKGLEVYSLPHRDWRGFSYKPLFKQLQEERNGEYFFERGFLYDPHALDDPAMIHGSHRYVLQRSASTGPILSSIILYVNKKELKESLNEQFRERHPHLPPSLTLSKIRNIKKAIVLIGNQLDIELTTLALGCILFEKLCLKGLVTKFNRRLSMAVCMLLACKYSENYSYKYHKTLELLLSFFDAEWDLPKKQILEAEFGAYVHLNFLLHLPHQHIHWMYLSLLKMINKSSRMYLKDDMYEVYRHDVREIERWKEEALEEKANAMAASSSSNININSSSNKDVSAAVTPAGVVIVGDGEENSTRHDNNNEVESSRRDGKTGFITNLLEGKSTSTTATATITTGKGNVNMNTNSSSSRKKRGLPVPAMSFSLLRRSSATTTTTQKHKEERSQLNENGEDQQPFLLEHPIDLSQNNLLGLTTPAGGEGTGAGEDEEALLESNPIHICGSSSSADFNISLSRDALNTASDDLYAASDFSDASNTPHPSSYKPLPSHGKNSSEGKPPRRLLSGLKFIS